MFDKKEYLKDVLAGKATLLFDGAMGSLLQARDLLAPGQNPDMLNIENPDAITEIHREFVEAGSQAVTANTFRSNSLKLGDGNSVYDIMKAAYDCAKAADPMFIAADMGSTGEMLEPYGEMSEEEAYDVFAEQARAADAIGFDMILIETMTDANEAVLAVKAAKDNSSLPVFASMSFEASGFTMFGNDPSTAAKMLADAGASCVGMNCSVGPAEAVAFVCAMKDAVDVPIMCQPNAGLPRLEAGETVYDITPDEFCSSMEEVIRSGVNVVGGCCGTTPEFISALGKLL